MSGQEQHKYRIKWLEAAKHELRHPRRRHTAKTDILKQNLCSARVVKMRENPTQAESIFKEKLFAVCGLSLDRDHNAALNILRRAGWDTPVPENVAPLFAASRGEQGQASVRSPRL